MGEHTIFSCEGTSQAPAGGPDVVLVHGYIASGRYMLPLMRRLAPHCRVYAPDLPGWGRSSKTCPRSLAGLADVLAAWVEEIGLRGPIFFGNSLGCQVVAELTVRHPALLSGLILFGPTIDPGARSLPRQASRLALDIPRERPSLWLLELLDLMRMGLPCAARVLRIMLDDRIEQKLPRIEIPTLLVRGSRDPIVPQTWAVEACRLLPHGRLIVLPGAAHAGNYSDPVPLAGAILPFIREVSRA